MSQRRKIKIFLGVVFLLFFVLPFFRAGAVGRSLSFGLSGSDVTAFQNKLIKQGYLAEGKATGYFGPLTQAAVKKFQCDQNIICSGASATTGYGVAGPRTQASLASVSIIPVQPSKINGTSLTGPAIGKFEISGWMPDWRAASSTKDVLPHLNQITSVMPFSYTVSSEGKISDSAKFAKEPWTSFIAEAKKQKVRVIPSILWGDGEAMHKILSNTKKRIALEDEIAALVKRYGFDGIDIDFEAKQSRTINYFSTFLKGLYQRMGKKWVFCTIEARMPLEDRYSAGAAIPADATEYANDYTQINKYCDRVEIMAYDQGTIDVRLNAARTAPYAPVADPGWVENIVTLAAQTISKNKIIIGVPTYGYEYRVTPLAGSGYQYKMLWPFNPKYATDIASRLGIAPSRTSANELGFIYNPDSLAAMAAPSESDFTLTQESMPSTTIAQNAGSQVNINQPFNYVTWSDSQAIADKMALARKLGVRGVAVFNFGGGADPTIWDALK
ncbi:MAG: glycosyl hydrolase family 18 protein [Candidatus Tagabacteria bacterium]